MNGKYACVFRWLFFGLVSLAINSVSVKADNWITVSNTTANTYYVIWYYSTNGGANWINRPNSTINTIGRRASQNDGIGNAQGYLWQVTVDASYSAPWDGQWQDTVSTTNNIYGGGSPEFLLIWDGSSLTPFESDPGPWKYRLKLKNNSQFDHYYYIANDEGNIETIHLEPGEETDWTYEAPGDKEDLVILYHSYDERGGLLEQQVMQIDSEDGGWEQTESTPSIGSEVYASGGTPTFDGSTGLSTNSTINWISGTNTATDETLKQGFVAQRETLFEGFERIGGLFTLGSSNQVNSLTNSMAGVIEAIQSLQKTNSLVGSNLAGILTNDLWGLNSNQLHSISNWAWSDYHSKFGTLQEFGTGITNYGGGLTLPFADTNSEWLIPLYSDSQWEIALNINLLDWLEQAGLGWAPTLCRNIIRWFAALLLVTYLWRKTSEILKDELLTPSNSLSGGWATAGLKVVSGIGIGVILATALILVFQKMLEWITGFDVGSLLLANWLDDFSTETWWRRLVVLADAFVPIATLTKYMVFSLSYEVISRWIGYGVQFFIRFAMLG